MNELISKDDKEFLGSILQKDNERILAEMEGSRKDVVFLLGFEGGKFSISRHKCLNGKTYYIESDGGMSSDENDNEVWIYDSSAPSISFDALLENLKRQYGSIFLCMEPYIIHSHVQESVKIFINKSIEQLSNDDRKKMSDRLPKNADEWVERVNFRKQRRALRKKNRVN